MRGEIVEPQARLQLAARRRRTARRPAPRRAAGRARSRAAASQPRSAGASCRLPPSLTTHIAASQNGASDRAQAAMQHRLVKLLGAPAPWLMGVVNVTPDSFTDGGRYLAADAAVAHGRRLLADGAHLLDLGGEFDGTRQPADHQRRGAGAAGARGARAGRARPSCRSTPTTRPRRRAASSWVPAVVNDVSALRADPEMAAVVRDLRPVLVMMHAKDGPLPHATDRPAHYGDVVRDVADWLAARIDVALAAGHRRRPDRGRPRLGQVPQPRAGPHLGAAGAVRAAGRPAGADPGPGRDLAQGLPRRAGWPSAIRSRSSRPWWRRRRGRR